MKIMEVCGTHTMAIARSGIKKFLPKGIELISGPGCPVCVTPQSEIDKAIEIAKQKSVIIATFGDMMRVPGTKKSLADTRAEGADVRVIYSCLDALDIAKKNSSKKVVFLGIGFETTSPTVGAAVSKAKKENIKNFFILSNFKVIFPALEAICRSKDVRIDGFICPGHVSVITGALPYARIAKRYKKSCVITGFDDIDIIKGITCLAQKIKNKDYSVEIEYKRAVRPEGNREAKQILSSVFKIADSKWRGLGIIKKSGLKLNKKYQAFNAEKIFKINIPKAKERKGCACGDVLKGIKRPADCRLFKKVCTPQTPVGPCMVSQEGACAAYYRYGR